MKLLSLSSSVLLKMLEMWVLVFLGLYIEPGIWLALRLLAIQLRISASCLLVLYQSFDYKQVKECCKILGWLITKLFFQLELLSVRTILKPEISKTVWTT